MRGKAKRDHGKLRQHQLSISSLKLLSTLSRQNEIAPKQKYMFRKIILLTTLTAPLRWIQEVFLFAQQPEMAGPIAPGLHFFQISHGGGAFMFNARGFRHRKGPVGLFCAQAEVRVLEEKEKARVEEADVFQDLAPDQ